MSRILEINENKKPIDIESREKQIYIDETIAYIKNFNDSSCKEVQLSDTVEKLISLSKKFDYDIELLFFALLKLLSKNIDEFIN